MTIDELRNVLTESFYDLWYGVVTFLPRLLIAILIFLLGWLVGSIIGRWVAQVIKSLKIDQAFEQVGTGEVLARAGFRLNVGAFVGALIKWFVIIVFLVAAMEVLGLTQVTAFLQLIVVGFLPNVIVAAFILLSAALIASLLQRVVTGSAMAAGIASAKFLGGVTKYAVWVFAILASLHQLGVAPTFIEILVIGLVAMLALAGGLAFGLGGREAAGRYIEKLQHDIGSHHR